MQHNPETKLPLQAQHGEDVVVPVGVMLRNALPAQHLAEDFQAEIARFQKEVEDAQNRIGELQSKREGKQKMILSPESKAQLENLQKTQAEANKSLRRVRKELRQEVDSLENWLKVLNIAAMPLVVAGTGIGLAVARRKRTSAR